MPSTGGATLPFSELVKVGNTLFISGQIGNMPGTLTLAPGGIGPETRRALENISAIVQRHGSSMEQVIKCTEEAAFDVLVNNAGTNRPKPITEVTEADYDAVLGLNLRSAFFVAQAAARRMIDAKLRGSLIHVGSQMGHVGGRNRTLYCASKWGLEGMSKAMALDLAPYGIRSNTIAPTFIETPMTAPFFEDAAFRAEVLGRIKLGRLGRVEDLLGSIIYLASEASALVTGTSLVIDGGWTAD